MGQNYNPRQQATSSVRCNTYSTVQSRLSTARRGARCPLLVTKMTRLRNCAARDGSEMSMSTPSTVVSSLRFTSLKSKELKLNAQHSLQRYLCNSLCQGSLSELLGGLQQKQKSHNFSAAQKLMLIEQRFRLELSRFSLVLQSVFLRPLPFV